MKKAIFRFAAVTLLISLLLSLCSCSSAGGSPASFGSGKDAVGINEEELRYFFLGSFYDCLGWPESEGKTDSELAEDAFVLMEDALRYFGAVRYLCAKYGITGSSIIESEVENTVASYKKMKGDGFDEWLASANLSEELLRTLLTQQEIEMTLRAYCAEEASGVIPSDDATVEADAHRNFYRAVQILISEKTPEGKAEAEEYLSRALAGEDFDDLIRDFNDRHNYTGGTDGYCFTDGQMIAPFEEAVKKTEPDAVYPEVVESEAGYHVIKRLVLTDEYIDENFTTIRNNYKTRRFNELLAACEEENGLTFGKDFSTAEKLLERYADRVAAVKEKARNDANAE